MLSIDDNIYVLQFPVIVAYLLGVLMGRGYHWATYIMLFFQTIIFIYGIVHINKKREQARRDYEKLWESKLYKPNKR